jgi:hypothetical protein
MHKKVLSEISSLANELVKFRSLLKANTLKQQLGQMSREVSAPAEDQAAATPNPAKTVEHPPTPDWAKETDAPPMSLSARAALDKHADDEQMASLEYLHNKVTSDLKNRHPARSPKDLDRVENQIMARAAEIDATGQYRASSPKDRASEVRQNVAHSKLPKHLKDLSQNLSPMQQRAKEAERKQIESYTGQKTAPEKKGLWFQLSREPIYETYGQDSESPSSTSHFIHLNDMPIGYATVTDHRRTGKVGQFASGDDARQHIQISLPNHFQYENQVKLALMNHLKSDEFKKQLGQFSSPMKTMQRVQELKQEAATGPKDESAPLTPDEIREERDLSQQIKDESKSSSVKNYSPSAPLMEYSREKALEGKNTSVAPDKKKEETKAGKSERTKELARQAYGKKETPAAASNPDKSTQSLRALMHDSDPATRNMIINHLISHSDPEKVKLLLDHDDSSVRRKAFDRLEEMRRASAS